MHKKNLLITGTSKGIGKLLAEYYLSQNYNVTGISRSDASISNQNYEHFQLDLSSLDEVKKFFSSFRPTHGDINYLINNAGVAQINSLFLMSPESMQNQFNINTIVPIEIIQFVSRQMQTKKFGRIVNITTTAGAQNMTGQGAYISSKKALEYYGKNICDELALYGITINNLAVSYFESDITKNMSDEKKKLAVAKQKIKRACEINDITNAIDFFFCPKSDFISGQTLALAGL